MKKNQIEILSPVGSEEAFYAAIHQGADAVYLGGLKFGARAYANNFTIEKLKDLIQYAHLYQVKVYYALNTLIKDIEFPEFKQVIEELNKLPVDAFIIQDFGVLAYLRKHYPRLILHGSTQMNLHNVMDATFAKELGFDRIVLARECSLEGIEDISKKVDIELEVFVHGALCYSYSGQCLMSSLYGGRSGNRGKCAQPCRLAYQSKGHKGNLISLKDQMTLEFLPKLISLGIHSYKIEGRMKGESYVAYTTYLYSKYRDLACLLQEQGRIQDYKVEPKEVYQMNQLYNRGHYNQGYFENHNHKDMISLSISKHQGVEIGTIRNEKGFYRFNLLPNILLQKGDLLEMHLPDGQVKEIQISDEGKKADLQLFHKKKELPLFRLRDSSLQDEISMMKKKKLPLSLSFFVQENHPMLLSLESTGIKIQVEGERASVAINKAFDEQAFYKQLAKIQDTVFEISSYTIHIEGKVFVPTSSINALRRRGVETLQEEILKQYEEQLNSKKDNFAKNLAKNSFQKAYEKAASVNLYDSQSFSSKFNVILRTEEQLFAIIESELSDVFRICIDMNNLT
ncbi:MAG: U32 family peptidase, partial [Vallitaleaceae bacterium]|nr:U32 family peptidase [Vallitaleaceae bacterium]